MKNPGIIGNSLALLFPFLMACGASGGGSASHSETPLPGGNTLRILNTHLLDAQVGAPYSTQIQPAGGQAPYSFQLTAGSLPTGLHLNPATGNLSGNPINTGSFQMTFQVTDSATPPATGHKVLLLKVTTGTTQIPDLQFTNASLAAGVVGTPYTEQLTVTGGTTPYTFSIPTGSLPTGLVMDASGRLSGTPVVSGIFQFTAMVVDSGLARKEETRPFSITIASHPGQNPVASVTASRTTGVAPLSVFFDASSTTSTITSKPFHHLHYQWDFADPNSRRPTATGPLAAHVFDSPGTYNVQLTVTDTNSKTSIKAVQIQVTDPATVFAGVNTICFSNTINFDGAPTGSRHVTTSSFDTVMTYFSTGRRLLLRRGDTFSASTQNDLSQTGPAILGAFGTGGTKDPRGIYDNNPVVQVANGTKLFFLRSTDLRFMDIRFVKSGSNSDCCFDASHRVTQNLLYRLVMDGFYLGVCIHHDIIQYYQCAPHDQNTTADCIIRNNRLHAVYTGGNRMAILGNDLDTAQESHVIRVTYANRAVLTGNSMQFPGAQRHCLKIHAPVWPNDPTLTQKVVISGNLFRGHCDWPITIGPQDGNKDERLKDILFERNTVLAVNRNQVGMMVSGSEITLRNNVFNDLSANAWGLEVIRVSRRGIEPIPSGVEIYHNTAYCGHSLHGGNFFLVNAVEHQGPALLIKNNLVYAPNCGGTVLASGSASKVTMGNLTGINPVFKSPGGGDFSLLSGSPGIDTGVTAPVMEDYLGATRSGTNFLPDVGAYESH